MALTTAQAAAILNSGGNTSSFTAATWAALAQVEAQNNAAAAGVQVVAGNPMMNGAAIVAATQAAQQPATQPVVTPTSPVVTPVATGPTAAEISAAQTAALIANQNAIEAARVQAQKNSAFDMVNATFKNYGIDMDGTGLAALVKGWIQDNKSADWVALEIQKTSQYAARFTGMAALNAAGHHMSEAEYISQEVGYTNLMKQWALPTGFYDAPEDFGKFIANGVSVKELDDRIAGAKTFLDTSAPSAYKDALRDLYGVSEGGMLAYVLDGDMAQVAIQKQLKASEMAGAASLNGFNLTVAQAEKYGATLGSQYDSFGADARNTLEANLAAVGKDARTQARLAAIDQEQYTATDALDAAVMNDASKQTASQTRVQREQARFNGSSAVSTATFGRTGSI